jgi:predicted alpha-1,6-mannanase (GH76 family)
MKNSASKFTKYAEECLTTLQQWYNDSTGLWESTNWWNAANAVTAIIDYSGLTGSDEYMGVVENTFERCKRFEVKMQDSAENWICTDFINDYYDDEGWWVLAWIDAFDLTGNKKYLDMAGVTFSDMCKGWDNKCGGGIYWKKPNIGKNAVQNELFMLCALKLHKRSGGKVNGLTHLEWAVKTWEWFESTGMINDNYQVDDGLNRSDCKVKKGRVYTYNQGVILSALVELSKETNNADLLELAEKIADAAISISVYENGILKDPNEPELGADGPQFKGIFMRHLAYLYTVTKKETYSNFIQKNAISIWENARNAENEVGGIWTGPFDKADASRQSSALDCFNAAIVVTKDE